MLCRNMLKIVQSCTIKEDKFKIDEIEYCGYGITVSKIIDNDVLIIASVDNISTDEEVVKRLMRRIESHDVDPITLHDIVEDYLVEITSI